MSTQTTNLHLIKPSASDPISIYENDTNLDLIDDKFGEIDAALTVINNLTGEIGNLGNVSKIVTGSYVGTGTYGEANPCCFTFDFAPKIFWLLGYKDGAYYTPISVVGNSNYAIGCGVVPMNLITTTYANNMPPVSTSSGSVYHTYTKKSGDGKTVYWYNTDNANSQYNYSGYIYYYVAIG